MTEAEKERWMTIGVTGVGLLVGGVGVYGFMHLLDGRGRDDEERERRRRLNRFWDASN